RLSLTPVCESGEDVLLVENLSKAYDNNVLFTDINMDIKRGEHVALIGSNGTGKTTILKIINRLIRKDSGKITLGSRVRIGYFDQEHHDLDTSKTIFDEMSDSFPDMNNTRIRNTLAAFLFTGEDVYKKISDLSGGERGRLSLAKLMLSPANFLVLDEPTNHLDIPSKEILEDAIKSYEGTILYVSHDRYFINKTATRILDLRDRTLTNYKGDYTYYEENKDRLYYLQHEDDKVQSKNISENHEPAKSDGRKEYENKKNEYARQRKLANDLKKTEKLISETEDDIAKTDEQLNDPANGTNAALLIELSQKKEELEEKLLELYSHWEELQ
ncbi:MAG TPA: ABC transporter, partial [Lachnospiraceae bacterium]|nr:ABC transporter [Lachnospiraceae bacterium]